MKTLFGLLTLILTTIACNQSHSVENQEKSNSNQADHTIQPQILFSLADAEKILGEESSLEDSSFTIHKNSIIYNSSFKANEKSKSGKTGSVYFMYEEYAQDSTAHRIYTDIKKANEDHGIKTLDDLGDEAYFHTDHSNFYFVMARKGARMIRIKVNKITGNTSLDAFNEISRNIIKEL